MSSFITRQKNKKISVIEYFLLQKNKRIPHRIISQQKQVLKKKHIRQSHFFLISNQFISN